jgi:hypothetical protein
MELCRLGIDLDPGDAPPLLHAHKTSKCAGLSLAVRNQAGIHHLALVLAAVVLLINLIMMADRLADCMGPPCCSLSVPDHLLCPIA